MLLKTFYDDRLAQFSYMVGCQANSEAVLIDPARDITPYLEAAEKHGMHIVGVTETHIHADYVSGTRELAAATGAQMYLSAMGTDDWQYDFPNMGDATLLNDGDIIEIGNVRLRVIHTPGHTPEHICFALVDGAITDEEMGIFTGDFLFVGNIGRPDLLEESAGMIGTAKIGAEQQFQTVKMFKGMPDYLQVFPGHGSGSACGKGIGAVPTSTLGYEKRFNPAFQFDAETDFVNWLLDGQPEAPPYFAIMKRVNRVGPALLRDLPQAQHIKDAPGDFIPEDAILIDTRPAAMFASNYYPGSVNIPISHKGFSTWAGDLVKDGQPTFFIAFPNDVMSVLNAFYSVGIDNIPGYFTPDSLEKVATASINNILPAEVGEDALILDVRGGDEYHSVRIPGAMWIPMAQLLKRVEEVPQDKPVVVQCAGGLRSQIIVSYLHSKGYDNIDNMQGGIMAWQAAGLKTEQG